LEGKPLYGGSDVVPGLGKPARYSRAIEDIVAFRSTLSSVPKQVGAASYNAVYELGVMYVCVRNIAMSASWHLCSAADFTRWSPFKLGREVSNCPLSAQDYERSMACRMASQRGHAPPSGIDAEFVLGYHNRVAPWLAEIQDRVQEAIE
jgi:hypothetical protein